MAMCLLLSSSSAATTTVNLSSSNKRPTAGYRLVNFLDCCKYSLFSDVPLQKTTSKSPSTMLVLVSSHNSNHSNFLLPRPMQTRHIASHNIPLRLELARAHVHPDTATRREAPHHRQEQRRSSSSSSSSKDPHLFLHRNKVAVATIARPLNERATMAPARPLLPGPLLRRRQSVSTPSLRWRVPSSAKSHQSARLCPSCRTRRSPISNPRHPLPRSPQLISPPAPRSLWLLLPPPTLSHPPRTKRRATTSLLLQQRPETSRPRLRPRPLLPSSRPRHLVKAARRRLLSTFLLPCLPSPRMLQLQPQRSIPARYLYISKKNFS